MIARFGDCEIDLDRLEIRSAGTTVAVEPQVFDVLSYLIEHRDRVVTKEELLDNVWGDRFVTESALTSRIKSARRAVGDNGRDQAVIRTAHGRGYQFVADIVMGAAPTRGSRTAPSDIELPDADTPALDDAWPLVGRHDEIEELDRLLLQDGRSGVLLTGPASIGKTRLARVALERAATRGMTTRHVSGHAQAERIPLAALSHLLPSEVLDAGDAASDIARTVVFQRARTAIAELADGDRLVLMVDNVDHLDDVSTALIGSLIASGSVFVVLTQRTGAGQTLAFDEFVRDGTVAHLALGPLDDTDLDILLYRVLAGPIDLASLQYLTSLSRGRPGALQQLVETCRASEALHREADVWRVVAPIQPTIGPPGPDQLLLDTLESAALTGAELLAVAHELDLDVAGSIVGDDEIDALDRAGLLTVVDAASGPRVSIAHAHVSALLEERIGPLRMRRHKRRLVEAISVDNATDHDRMRRVRWMLDVGDEPGPDETARAARFAVATNAGPTADVILDHLASTDAANEAMQLRAELHFRRGQVDRAEQLLDQVDGDALPAVTAATVLRRRATIRFHVRGRYDEALAMLNDAAPRLDGPAQHLVVAHWIGLNGFLGMADRILERAADLPDDVDESPRLEVLRGVAQAHLAQGAFSRAIATLDEHDLAARHLAAGAAQAGRETSLATRVAALVGVGDLDSASRLVAKHLPIGRRTMLAWLPIAAARTEMIAGRPRVARELITTPLAAARSQSLLYAEPQMIGILAQTSVRTDHVDDSLREIERCWHALDVLVGQLGWSLLVSIADVVAQTDLRAGLTERLVAEADDARAAGASLYEAELLMAAARTGAAGDVVDRLEHVVASIEGNLWSTRAAHARALVDDDETALREIEATYRSMGYDGFAAGVARTLAAAG